MTTAERRTALAPAKVNLGLEVLGPRDDGYHELVTIVQPLAFGDEVTVAPASGTPDELTLSGPYAAHTPTGPENLVLRALAALRTHGGVPALSVHIDKRIPPAGGLGGGASDAATVLRLAGEMFGIEQAVLLRAAAAIGSDEPALLLGNTVLASGRGEVVRQLPSLALHDVVLFPVAASMAGKTGRMFAELRAQACWARGDQVRELASRIGHGGHLTASDLPNSFAGVAAGQFPEIAAVTERMSGCALALAGAGPSLFWIGTPGDGATVAEQAREAGLDAILTTAGSPAAS